jgi:hypothetical protein
MKMDKRTKQLIDRVRLLAFEELRQEVKWAPWTIDNLLIVERAIDKLTAKAADDRYMSLE